MSQPFWIELQGEPFQISQSKRWPYIDETIANFPEVTSLANSFLTSPTRLFSTKTKSPEGNLFLKYHDYNSSYRGIWIPDTFPTLADLIRSIFDNWDGDSERFEDWIQQFFAQRIRENSIVNFQSNNSFTINIPPVFVLNQQQISGTLLHQLRNSVSTTSEISIDLIYDILEKNLPEQYRILIDKIYAENEISAIHLVRTYLQSLEMVDYGEYMHIRKLVAQLSPSIADYVMFNYLNQLLLQRKSIPEEIVDHLKNLLDNSTGMPQIVILRILSSYYKENGEILTQEMYLRNLMERAPQQSWSVKFDLINAQLGLSRCSVARGDYFSAMTFYSFARQGFRTIGRMQLSEEMEIEFQQISALSSSQLLQHGLYMINHNNLERNSFLILIDGIQSTLAHLIRYHDSPNELETSLIPLLQSATSTLKIYQNRVDQLFHEGVPYDEMMKTSQLLSVPENRGRLVPVLQQHIETLSFKDQKMIEKISMFSNDGRHIGDYFMEDGKFKAMEQNSSQSLFSSAMSAVSMLISEATESDSSVEEISVGNKTVVYNQGKYITFCLIANSSNSNLKQLLNNIVKSVEGRYEDDLKNWAGNLNIFRDLPELLTPLSFYTIDHKKEEEEIHTP